MGYTHYWQFKAIPKGKAASIERKYKKALRDCQRIALAYHAACKELDQADFGLSGYTAHTKVGQYGGLKINGKGDLAHEDFIMREHYTQNLDPNLYFGFCKTARKPYDMVITACLTVLKAALGDLLIVNSDGGPSEWVRGVNYAETVLKRSFKCPVETDRAA